MGEVIEPEKLSTAEKAKILMRGFSRYQDGLYDLSKEDPEGMIEILEKFEEERIKGSLISTRVTVVARQSRRAKVWR